MKRTLTFLSILVVISFYLTNCNSGVKNAEKESANEHEELIVEEKTDCSDVHWSHHHGEEGPENWKNLCDDFLPCGGQAQSPINIVTQDIVEGNQLRKIEVGYKTSDVEIINNGHTVQFNITGENRLMLNNKEYDLLQFHYHAKSEHEIDGEQYPIEVHFVHKNTDSDYAVLGIMYKEGAENKLFAEYLSKFPENGGKYEGEGELNLSSLLPSNLDYYYYSGSLTTPPCSEIVTWYVFKEPLEASEEQIEQFSEILHDNYRPVMPLNGREVFSYSH